MEPPWHFSGLCRTDFNWPGRSQVEKQVLLFEFKVVELTPEGRALQQIKDKGYADKYRARGEPIHLIGVEFSKASRNIVGFEVETLLIL